MHSQFIDMMTETDELVGFLAFFVDMMEHKKIHCINEIFFLTSAQKKTLCIGMITELDELMGFSGVFCGQFIDMMTETDELVGVPGFLFDCR